jgi:hypothetical protein
VKSDVKVLPGYENSVLKNAGLKIAKLEMRSFQNV